METLYTHSAYSGICFHNGREKYTISRDPLTGRLVLFTLFIMAKEYYELLGISENATADEIKKAYRKKAMECHPDRCAGDKTKEAEFKKINEAYSVLSDPQKKANYDRFGSADGMGGFGGFGGGFQGGFDASDLGDIFSSFFGGGFGGGGRRRRADIGEDIEIRMKISLEDAIRGTSRKIAYDRKTTCHTCDGKGGKTKTCTQCGGSGSIRERVQTVFGVMEQTRTCPTCHGTGEEITEKCTSCGGQGKTTEKREKTIEVPKGIEDGMSIKMREEGHAGKDGSGDLYVTFSVPTEEAGLSRKGSDLHYTVRISPAEAALGVTKTVTLPILGKKEFSLRAGTQTGEEVVFRGEGLHRVDGGRTGNLILHVLVDIPTKLSADQKKLYEALLVAEGGKPKKGWLEELFGG